MFHKEKRVIARKQHTCNCCHSQINKGDFYMKMEFVDLGKMNTWKLCFCCEKARQDLIKSLKDDYLEFEYSLGDIDDFRIKKGNKVEFINEENRKEYIDDIWHSVGIENEKFYTVREVELVDFNPLNVAGLGAMLSWVAFLEDSKKNQFDVPLYTVRKYFY